MKESFLGPKDNKILRNNNQNKQISNEHAYNNNNYYKISQPTPQCRQTIKFDYGYKALLRGIRTLIR